MPAHTATLLSPGLPAAAAAADPEGLFHFLDQNHQQMQRMLITLHEVVDAIEMDGLRPEVRAHIRTVLDWFNTHARDHHQDEERHVFPALMASPQEETRAMARQLVQDHGWLEEDWLEISPSLASAADGYQWFDLAELRHGVEVFEQLYLDHMVLEESLAYPAARQLISTTEQQTIGLEMARRRALRDARGEARSEARPG